MQYLWFNVDDICLKYFFVVVEDVPFTVSILYGIKYRYLILVYYRNRTYIRTTEMFLILFRAKQPSNVTLLRIISSVLFFSIFFPFLKINLRNIVRNWKVAKYLKRHCQNRYFNMIFSFFFFSFFINITIANHSTRLFVRLWSAYDKKRRKISNLNEKKTREKN